MKKTVFVILLLTTLLTGCVQSNESDIESPLTQGTETEPPFSVSSIIQKKRAKSKDFLTFSSAFDIMFILRHAAHTAEVGKAFSAHDVFHEIRGKRQSVTLGIFQRISVPGVLHTVPHKGGAD